MWIGTLPVNDTRDDLCSKTRRLHFAGGVLQVKRYDGAWGVKIDCDLGIYRNIFFVDKVRSREIKCKVFMLASSNNNEKVDLRG